MKTDPSLLACYALVSGGKDSLSAANCLHECGRLKGCVALDTGVSTPDWRDFVIKTCDERKWPLEFFATDERYDDLVLKQGFPGPAKHKMIMERLKGRAIRKFRKVHPDGVLASGVRADESQRRKFNTSWISMWEGTPIIAVIYTWTDAEVWEYFHDRGFERAPAYHAIQISGDCCCGAFAREGEREATEFHYPTLGARFAALGAELVSTGACPPHRATWGWGWNKPMPARRGPAESMICAECAPRDLFQETMPAA